MIWVPSTVAQVAAPASQATIRVANGSEQTAQITKFFIAEAASGSGYETGPLHIIYSDGTEIVQTLPPLKPSTDKEIVFKEVYTVVHVVKANR